MHKRERINMDIAVCDDSMEALNDVRNVLIETNRVNLIECFNDIDRFMRDVEDVFMQRTNIEGYLKKPVKKNRVIKIIDKIENSKRNMNFNNAINACLEIEDKSKRFISVKCDYSGDYMNVLVKNSADKNQKKKIRSSEHGWGMKILDDIAQQYNGRLEYGFKDGIYSTMVSLVYTNDQEEGI